MNNALNIHVKGIVQGVGFRPFVYRLAKRYLISGWVLNAADGVTIHAEGDERLVDEFVLELANSAPAAAHVEEIDLKEVPLEDYDGFEIRFSDDAAVEETTLVSPDLATCPECVAELFDEGNRRYRYPFINCTNCGPRFTIIERLPYDRAATSMACFEMCEPCAHEYADPADRRFHAQPDACFDCGPAISWYEFEGGEGNQRGGSCQGRGSSRPPQPCHPLADDVSGVADQRPEASPIPPMESQREEDAQGGSCQAGGRLLRQSSLGETAHRAVSVAAELASDPHASHPPADDMDPGANLGAGSLRGGSCQVEVFSPIPPMESQREEDAQGGSCQAGGRLLRQSSLGETAHRAVSVAAELASDPHASHPTADDVSGVSQRQLSPPVPLGRAEQLARPEPIFARAVELLCAGGIVAVKGLGGFHLVCDACNQDAVARLRARKHREGKAFAVMMNDVDAVRELCAVSTEEEAVLTGSQRPIVLLRKLPGAAFVPGLADALPELGVMLPYTPVQHLLMHDFVQAGGRMLVMTSGNIHDEPIVTDDVEALRVFSGIADAVMGNNRKILSRYDDSVVRILDTPGGPAIQCVRRARGFAPVPLALPAGAEQPVLLAAGPEQKNTFCLVRGGEAFVSQHIGDLENAETFDAWREAALRYETLFEAHPVRFACDKHPEYLSTKWVRERQASEGAPVCEVQHHHAHIAAVMAEHGLEGPVCGIAFDGTGYGEDGAIWGGEVMLCNLQAFERFANMAYVPMPGGAACVKHPLRMAYGALWEFDLLEHPVAQRVLEPLGKTADMLGQMIDRGINTPYTSSVGRLFDAASALLGICTEPLYEGEAAILLEAAVWDTDCKSPISPMESQREASECPDSARRATERTSVREESRTRVEDGCSGVSQRQLNPAVASARPEQSQRGGSCQGRGSSRPPLPCHPLADDVSGVADKRPEASPIPPMECQREASMCPDSARRATERTSVRDESRTRVEDGCMGASQRQLDPAVASARPEQSQQGGSCQAGGRLLRQSSLGETAHRAVSVAAELASDPHASHPPADDMDPGVNLGAGPLRGGSCQGRGSSRPPLPCHPLADDVSGVADKRPEASPIPPMECQREASARPELYYFDITKNVATEKSTAQDTSVVLLDAAPVFAALLDDMQAGVPRAIIARRFHDAFVEVIVQAAQLVRSLYGIDIVALGGGVFLNRYLTEHALAALSDAGFTVAINRNLPPSDGCISFGQAAVAVQSNPE